MRLGLLKMEIEKNAWLPEFSKRTMSPFFLYFVAAWVIHNHDIVAALTDSLMNPMQKSEYIAIRVDNIRHMVFIPMLHALIVFGIWVCVNFAVSIAWDYARFWNERFKKMIRENHLYFSESEVDEIRDGYLKRISVLDKENAGLRGEMRSLSADVDKTAIDKAKIDDDFSSYRVSADADFARLKEEKESAMAEINKKVLGYEDNIRKLEFDVNGAFKDGVISLFSEMLTLKNNGIFSRIFSEYDTAFVMVLNGGDKAGDHFKDNAKIMFFASHGLSWFGASGFIFIFRNKRKAAADEVYRNQDLDKILSDFGEKNGYSVVKRIDI